MQVSGYHAQYLEYHPLPITFDTNDHTQSIIPVRYSTYQPQLKFHFITKNWLLYKISKLFVDLKFTSNRRRQYITNRRDRLYFSLPKIISS